MAPLQLGQAALLGGLAGLLAGLVSARLASPGPRRLVPDRLSWLLAAAGAVAMLLHPARQAEPLPLLAASGLVGLLLLVAASDLRERAVYPAVVYPGLLLAILLAPLLGSSLFEALLGAAASTVLFAAFYLLARARYGRGSFGAGDVSAGALLGAVVGFSQLPHTLALVSLLGLAAALAAALRARSLHASFPYAPTLCLAAFLTTLR